MKGDGHLYQRGTIWWALLYRDGRRLRESLRTTSRSVAEKRLAQLRRTRERGAYLEPKERRVHISELLDDLVVHLELKGAAVQKLKTHVRPVREELGHLRATGLHTATVERVQAEWRKAGLAPATINRRCEVLRQACRLAAKRTPPKLKAAPHIPMLRLENARQGFLGRGDFEALLSHLADDDVRDFVEWAYWTGMRRGEIRQLTWEMVDRETWTLALDPRAAKTRRGRVIALDGPLRAIMDRRVEQRSLDCQLVFGRINLKRFYRRWKAALEGAGLPPGLILHDLRRTAVRNMVRSGVSETTAMRISGHRTRAMFDRYNIVDETDVREALLRTAAHVAGQSTERKVRKHSATKPATTPRRDRRNR